MGLKASPTPGGTRNRQDFYRLNMNGKEVLIDAAGLCGSVLLSMPLIILSVANHTPALIEFAHQLFTFSAPSAAGKLDCISMG
ncbi:hypothetical protein ACHAXM_001187 [Skeletonema potamos]